MPPIGGINPVCHDRHKTVPEFIVILCDHMCIKSYKYVYRCEVRSHSLPIKDVLTLGRLTFASFFEKLILIAFILAAGQSDAFFVKIKFANELASRYR